MKRAFAGLVCAGLLAACAPEPLARAPVPVGTSAPSAEKAPPPRLRPGEKSGYLREIDDALALMSEVRELAATDRVQGTVIRRDALLARLRSEIEAELRPEQVLGTTELLFSLNVVPHGFDFLRDVLELYTSQLAGFYDPDEKRMYLLADLGQEAERVTLWHELVHALQDQHYDLQKLVEWTPDSTDRVSAVQALAEGDATSAMMDAMFANTGKRATDLPDGFLGPDAVLLEGNASLAHIPAILKRSVMAPYADGIGFTHYLRRKGGWASIDAAWKKPPVSTEQILHPEKYLAGELPEVVPLPPPPAPGATLAYHDVLGEQTLRLVFEDFMPARTASESASDWSGDRVAVYTQGPLRAVAVRLRFDRAASAARAARAFVRAALAPELETQRPGPLPMVTAEAAAAALKGGRFCAERTRRGPYAVLNQDREVAVVLGTFSRTSPEPQSESTCAVALTWATTVLAAR